MFQIAFSFPVTEAHISAPSPLDWILDPLYLAVRPSSLRALAPHSCRIYRCQPISSIEEGPGLTQVTDQCMLDKAASSGLVELCVRLGAGGFGGLDLLKILLDPSQLLEDWVFLRLNAVEAEIRCIISKFSIKTRRGEYKTVCTRSHR